MVFEEDGHGAEKPTGERGGMIVHGYQYISNCLFGYYMKSIAKGMRKTYAVAPWHEKEG